ncbi:DUF4184 family protein [Nocardia sp. NPDC059239]|uniref:DUF4184 family protein n=1 Tax=Nocardia sp. NPDC059239 TaxID=3346785 RepID=UPI0036B60C7F
MPFTLAHPAAVLPIRRVLWFPGLVAGSIAPDIPYYLRIGVDGELTHAGLRNHQRCNGFRGVCVRFRGSFGRQGTSLIALSCAEWHSDIHQLPDDQEATCG